MRKRIIIVGPGGAGKDMLRDRFVKKGFVPNLSYTTRPPRDYEKDGIDYYFISKKDFQDKIALDEFYEWKVYKRLDWYYGTTKKSFNNSDIFIMTPTGVADLKPEDRGKSIVIYLNIPESVRRERLLERNDADTVDGRIQVDNKDFETFTDYDIEISNPSF